jgi:hypothetical protein
MCILITVVDDGGRLFGVTSMSSNDDRTSSAECRMPRCYDGYIGYLDELSRASPRHTAVNNRRQKLRALTEAGLLHPNPDGVYAPLFTGGRVWSTACLCRKLL